MGIAGQLGKVSKKDKKYLHQEGIRSKEEIEAWRQAFPPPTTPKNTILAKLSKAISNATPVCMRSLLKK